MFVCSQQQLVCKSFFECSKPRLYLFCATHVCARSSNCRDPQLTYSETHGWVYAHSSNWSANVVECSKPANDFFIGFSLAYSATRMLCAHSSNWSAKVVECSKPSNDFFIDLFCKTHVCVCVCSQQQLANPRRSETSLKGQHTCVFQMTSSLTFSATHMCVCAHNSNCRDPQVTFSETHVCVPTAAIGRPTIGPWVQPSLATSSATHMCVCVCVCSQQQLVCQSC